MRKKEGKGRERERERESCLKLRGTSCKDFT